MASSTHRLSHRRIVQRQVSQGIGGKEGRQYGSRHGPLLERGHEALDRASTRDHARGARTVTVTLRRGAAPSSESLTRGR